MHKKMMHLTYQIREASEKKTLDKDALDRAIDLKWQGQCNCPYWHGIFGGLYLNHLRHATYSRFLQAESILESAKGESFIEHEVFDFDVDGHKEAILKNRYLNLYIAPSLGGSIFELDYKPASMNLLDTMTRRKEGYHSRLAQATLSDDSTESSIHDRVEIKEEGLEKYLVYDWYRRVSFLDHFLERDVDIEKFARNEYTECGDFVDQPYSAELIEKDDRMGLAMARDGHVWINKIWAPVIVGKMVVLWSDSSRFDVFYRVENRSDAHLKSLFGVETAWAMLAGNSADRYYHVNGSKPAACEMLSRGVVSDSNIFGIRDDAFKYNITLKADRKLDWWRFPIETVSLSESGFERNYQQSTVMPVMKLDLKPGDFAKLRITVGIDKTE